MLPEEYTTGSVQDVTDRIGNTLIEFNGKPIYVYSIKGITAARPVNVISVAFSLPDWKQINNIPMDDPGLSVTAMPTKLGYFNVDTDTIASLVRIPMRTKTQGISQRSAAILVHSPKCAGLSESPIPSLNSLAPMNFGAHLTDLAARGQWSVIAGHYIGSQNWAYFMISEAFVNAYMDKYPPIPKVIEEQSKPHTTAIHRRFAVMQDEFGDRFLIHKNLKVAKFLGDRLRYTPTKSYLSGDVERALQILPV